MSRRRATAAAPASSVGPPPFAGTPREQIPTDHPEYARRTLDELRRYWGMARLEDASFGKVWAEVKEAKLWQAWPPGNPYGDLDALCKAELGRDVRGVRAALAQAGALTPRLLGPSGSNQYTTAVDDVQSWRRGGHRAEYLVARLARDHPEHLLRLQRGEYPSVAAAARDAGIPYTPQVSVVVTVTGFAKAIRAKLTPEQIAELIAELNASS
jgi:hypothetical protein